MIRYEIKKIFSKSLSKVSLVVLLFSLLISCYFAITNVSFLDEQGKSHTGIAAAKNLREEKQKWKGVLDEAALQAVLDEYKKISEEYVFTEQGIAMLSAVLRSEIAIKVSIRIMETYVEMRKYLANNSLLIDKVNHLEARQIESDLQRQAFEQRTDERFEQVFAYIADHEESNQKVFYDGQIFDAFNLLTELIARAEQSIILIDGYIDVVTLNILAKKKDQVSVLAYTYPNARITNQDITNFNAQYPTLEVKRSTAFHDRFLILDEEEGYHIGASIKDAGKKCFAINRIEDIGVIRDVIQRAELTEQ